MKHIVFVTVMALISQLAFGMEPVISSGNAGQVNLENSLQFVSVSHSGFHSQTDTPAKLYDARPGHKMEKLTKITPNTYFTNEDAAGNQETQCVVNARDRALVITDLKTKKTISLYDSEGSHNRHTCAVFNSNGSLLAVGYKGTHGSYPTVVVWRTAWKIIGAKAFPSKDQDVTALAFNPVCTEIAVGCDDGTIKLWNYKSGRQIEIKNCHIKAVIALAYNQLQQLASLSEDSTIKIWGIGDDGLQCKQIIQLNDDPLEHDIIGFYPDESTVFSCNRYKTDQISFHKVNS